MAVNPWFKFYGGEFLADPKISSLSAQERACWITLLSLASTSSDPGTVEFLTIETLLEKSGVHFDPYDTNEWDKCISVLEKFARMRMIEKGDDGVISIVNWKKRQETNLTDAERAKSYRDRKRERHANVTRDVTTVTQEEKREEKKRVIHSPSSGEAGDGYDEHFLSFWAAYPKKVGKGDAAKAWGKLRPTKELRERIVASVEAHVKGDQQWKREQGRYIPNPSTYLSQRRFDDEIIQGQSRVIKI